MTDHPPDPTRLLSRPTSVHVVGAGGAGMSAIATVLSAMGHRVTGSDLRASSVADRLSASGVDVAIGHRAANLAGASLVTRSTAVGDDNPEIVEARRLGIPVLSRADMLTAIAGRKRTVAVAGTHGKTTTSSMLALILVEAGLHPSFLIGGDVNEIGTNAVWERGEWLVVEADESDGTFLRLPAELAVVTNVEADHLDHYGTFDSLREAFRSFAAAASAAVVGADDPEAAAIGREVGARLVGRDPNADVVVSGLSLGRFSSTFELRDGAAGWSVEVALPIPGLHNVMNAALAAAAAVGVGAPVDAAAAALGRFAGVSRRFEFRGEANGVTFVDDYAHLPTEIRAALAAARTGGWTRVVAVFQPHRYSRTSALWEELGEALADADVVVVTDVYGAGEAPIPGVSGRLVADALAAVRPGLPVEFVERRGEVGARVGDLLAPGDVCVTLGAGDLTTLADELRAAPRW